MSRNPWASDIPHCRPDETKVIASLCTILERIAKESNWGKLDDRSFDGLRIANMHRVKGLEFEHVFIVAANKRNVPHPKSIAYEDHVSLTKRT
ncbi:MAG: hypothetical protein GX998_00340 [Firmicutes bacterium]|nr:hypothetical protein [Bacillota bacterium]